MMLTLSNLISYLTYLLSYAGMYIYLYIFIFLYISFSYREGLDAAIVNVIDVAKEYAVQNPATVHLQ